MISEFFWSLLHHLELQDSELYVVPNGTFYEINCSFRTAALGNGKLEQQLFAKKYSTPLNFGSSVPTSFRPKCACA